MPTKPNQKPTPKEINRLLSLGPKELRTHVEETKFLQEAIHHYITVYGLTKEQIMKSCKLSQAQYYRNMKNTKRWDLDHLLKIVDLANRKT